MVIRKKHQKIKENRIPSEQGINTTVKKNWTQEDQIKLFYTEQQRKQCENQRKPYEKQ